MSDKRSGPRWLSYINAQIRSRGQAVDCLIRDFSSEGARIEVPGTTVVPGQTIDLQFPLEEATFLARVRWREGDEIGVAFEPSETMAPADPVQAHMLQQVLRLQAENAELRLEAAQLRHQLAQVAIGDLTVSR
jgi:PilZ domain